MKFILGSQEDTTSLSNYITTKYDGISELKSFEKNTEDNSIIATIMESANKFSNEKDLLNSVKQFASDNKISVEITY